MLLGAPLTRLDLAAGFRLEPAALAGKTQLQHLEMFDCSPRDAAELAQLLSHLQQLQQLTHLDLTMTLRHDIEGNYPPPPQRLTQP
jgi:hypothetical protein